MDTDNLKAEVAKWQAEASKWQGEASKWQGEAEAAAKWQGEASKWQGEASKWQGEAEVALIENAVLSAALADVRVAQSQTVKLGDGRGGASCLPGSYEFCLEAETSRKHLRAPDSPPRTPTPERLMRGVKKRKGQECVSSPFTAAEERLMSGVKKRTGQV